MQAVARAFTLTVLRRLDSSRKAAVVRFLSEAGLIGSQLLPGGPIIDALHAPPRLPARMPPPKIDLDGADLRNIPLRSVALFARSLEGADLRGADFRGAFLVAVKFDRVTSGRQTLAGLIWGEGSSSDARPVSTTRV